MKQVLNQNFFWWPLYTSRDMPAVLRNIISIFSPKDSDQSTLVQTQTPSMNGYKAHCSATHTDTVASIMVPLCSPSHKDSLKCTSYNLCAGTLPQSRRLPPAPSHRPKDASSFFTELSKCYCCRSCTHRSIFPKR